MIFPRMVTDGTNEEKYQEQYHINVRLPSEFHHVKSDLHALHQGKKWHRAFVAHNFGPKLPVSKQVDIAADGRYSARDHHDKRSF